MPSGGSTPDHLAGEMKRYHDWVISVANKLRPNCCGWQETIELVGGQKKSSVLWQWAGKCWANQMLPFSLIASVLAAKT